MALQANALVTLAAAKGFLTLSGGTHDTNVENAINRATERIEAWCGRPLKKATYTNYRLAGPCSRQLRAGRDIPAGPIAVAGTITIKVDGITQTVWKSEADGDPVAKDVIVQADSADLLWRPNLFYRSRGWSDGAGRDNPYNVLLTYDGGLEPVPEDLQEACFLLVQRNFVDQQQQRPDHLLSVTAAGGEIASAVTLLDAALPRRVMSNLDRYRRIAAA